MKASFYFIFFLLIWSCSNREPTTFPVVKFAGALKNVTQLEDTTNHIFLDTINPHRRLYGLGPLSGMTGEILVIDGRPYVSKLNRKGMNRVRMTYDVKSPYFVYTHVRGWQEADLPEDSVLNNQNLGHHLELLAKKNGINAEKPFPFMLKGQFRRLTYHISYMPKKNGHHKMQLVETSHTDQNVDVIIVGFFSKQHQNIFTPPGSNIVMTFMTTSASHVGQIDELVLKGKKVQLMLPE